MQVAGWLKLSVLVALVTMALKTAAWWVSGSVGLLSDAMESGVNLAGAAFALGMVTIAARPPDADHPFGHAKAEYFASGFEGMLIGGAAIAIAWAAAQRLLAPQPLQQLGLGLALSVLSSVLNGLLAWGMRRHARHTRSIALEADARHLFTDVWTSAGVVVGLIGAHFSGWLWLDPLIALAVALNILREGAHLVRRSADGLMDGALDAPTLAQVRAVLARFAQPELRIDHVATRQGGQRRFVELHLHVPAAWTLGQAAALRARVEQALTSEINGLHVSIQLLPLDREPAS